MWSIHTVGFPGAKNAADTSSICVLGRSPEGGNGNPLNNLAWEIPWTEKPGRRQSMGLQRVGYNLATKRHPYNEILFSYKKNEILIHATMWMNLENIMVSERNQTQNATYFMI